MAEDNQFLWDQFIKLGDMIGDGLHHEEPWISKEYKKLSRILVPEIKEDEKIARQIKNKRIDDQIKNLIPNRKCKCGGTLKQHRSGSKICSCTECKARYKATKTKK